jgi:UDP:flavonoid glycosyltransferase YjiC (YdhE family)
MRIGIQTWGSEGDIRPFIALAGGLQAEGHKVSLVLTCIDNKDFSPFSERFGFEISHIATPVLKNQAEFDTIGASIIRATNPLEQASLIVSNFFYPAAGDMYSASQALCRKSDLVIGHYFLYLLRVAADKFKVPVASVTLAHNIIPTGNRRPIGFPNLGRWLHPFWWWVLRKAINRKFISSVNILRNREGLPDIRDLMTEVWVSQQLNLIAVSPTICKRQNDWGEHHNVCGFFNLPDSAFDWQMPDDLKNYLDKGEHPVYMTFGSLMPFTDEERRRVIQIFREASHMAECRAIIQVPEDEINTLLQEDRVYFTPPIPHRFIFPYCSAVVHHGGAGTTQTSAFAGIPSVVVAHIMEQCLWGSELLRLKMSPKVITRRSLTAKNLAHSIRDVLDSPKMRENAKRVGESMKREDGVKKAVELIGKCFNAK